MDNGILPFLPPMDRTAVLQAGNGNGPAQLRAWYLSGSCRPVLRLVCNFFQMIHKARIYGRVRAMPQNVLP